MEGHESIMKSFDGVGPSTSTPGKSPVKVGNSGDFIFEIPMEAFFAELIEYPFRSTKMFLP